MKRILNFGLIIMMVFTVISCEKGEQGEPGNANVKTTIVTVLPGDWTGTSVVEAEKYLNIITDDIAEFGAVFVYLNIGDKMYKPIPYTWPGASEDIIYRFKTQPGIIKFEIYSSGTTVKPSTNRIYKVVAMEASEYDYAKRVKKVDFSDYAQVIDFINSEVE